MIAGGYATGRALVEFFLPAGPWGGRLGMAVSMGVWSAVLMVSFELARRARAYDYRSFFKLLLGRGWFVFEIAVLLTLVDTGVAMLHAINERVAKVFEEGRRPMPQALRPALAVSVMVLSVYAATAIGLVELIAKGYRALARLFLAVYVLPLMTWGLWRLWRGHRLAAATAG